MEAAVGIAAYCDSGGWCAEGCGCSSECGEEALLEVGEAELATNGDGTELPAPGCRKRCDFAAGPTRAFPEVESIRLLPLACLMNCTTGVLVRERSVAADSVVSRLGIEDWRDVGTRLSITSLSSYLRILRILEALGVLSPFAMGPREIAPLEEMSGPGAALAYNNHDPHPAK